MPLYEYECRKCGGRFEEIQKFSDEPLRTHPDCGGELRKLLSAPAIQFKGTGWYVTDYGRAGQGKPDDGEGKKAEAKSETKAESKGETKSESKGSSESTKSTTSDTSKK